MATVAGAPGSYPLNLVATGGQVRTGNDAGPRYAGVWARVAASLIDAAVLAAFNYIAFVALVFFIAINEDPADAVSSAASALALVLGLLVLNGLYIVPQEALWGRTLGKRVLGIRVVNADGGAMTAEAALIRYLFLFFWFVGLGGIVTLTMVALSGTRQRLGDRVAGTIVVRGR